MVWVGVVVWVVFAVVVWVGVAVAVAVAVVVWVGVWVLVWVVVLVGGHMSARTAILLLSAAMVSGGSAYLGALCERQRYEPGTELVTLCRSTTEAQARALDACTSVLCDLASGSLLSWEAAVYCEGRR